MKPNYKFGISSILPPVIGLSGVMSMLLISHLLKNDYLPVLAFTKYKQLNLISTMQLLVLPISSIAIGLIYLYDSENFRKFFRKGDLSAKAKPLKLLGIKENNTWKEVGLIITAIITAGTAIFMTIVVIMMNGAVNMKFLTLLPMAFVFSTTNAWSEEIFTRFVVVAGLDGRLKSNHIYWVSAAVFGIPHYFGTPGGPVGMLMAGFLGWLLSKSVYETRGIFWAWFIHFIQDVVIFTANLMILIGSSQ